MVLPTSPAPARGRGAALPGPVPDEPAPAPRQPAGGLSPRWSALWAATAAVLAAATMVIVVLGAGKGPASWMVCFAAIGAAFWALAAAVRWSTGDRRRGWALTAAGLVCTLAGASLDAVAGTAMVPNLGNVAIDAVWLAAMPLFIAGIVVVDRAALRGADAGRIVVDVLVVAIASAIVLEFVVKASPVVDESALDLNVLHGGVTVGGAVAAWLLLQPVIFGRDRLRLTRLLLIAFYVALATVNTAWMMVAGFPPNPSVALLALMLGLAAMTAAARPPSPSQPQPPPRGFATAADLVPFLLAAGMGLAVVATELSGHTSSLVLFGTLATVGLLLVRQTLLIRSSRQALAGAEARALTDPLTGLGNARAFDERLRIEVARSARHGIPLGLLLIDVDHLKLVNDTAGHPAGDRLLRGVATQMQELSRSGDVCCRIGGDEFALLAPGSDVAAAEGLAERILGAVAGLEAERALPEPPSVSIGVAVMPEDGASRTELLDFADASLYAAKRSGRGRIGRHDPDATHDLERELERARAALLARESDFRAVFEASLDAMLITDDAGTVLDVNRALTALDGRSRDQLLGRPLEDLADPRARPVVQSERAEVSAGQGVTGEVEVVLVASGRRVTLEYGATQFAPGRQLIVLRDVTERRAAEAELGRREAENRAVLEALPDLMLRFDRQGVVRGVVATDRGFPVLVDPQGMSGRSLPELGVSMDAARAVLAQVRATIDGGQLTTQEHELDWVGRRRHFEFRMVPYTGDDALALVRDITDRREAERAREAADERYRLVVETANEGLVLTDGADKVVFANQRFAEMLGWDPADIPGTVVTAFVHPDDRARHQRGLDAVRAVMTPGRFDLRLVTRTGEPVWVQLSGTPFTDESGAYAGGLAMLTDITARKATEERLRESERRFRGLADAAPMMVWTADVPDGGLDFVNQRIADFTGRPLEDHRGYGFLGAVHPDDRAQLIEVTQQAWRSASPFQLEHRLRRHDGEYRWMLATASPRFGADGALAGYVGSALDITERRAAEEELRSSERQFRELADTAPMLVWVSESPSGGVSFLNRSWLEFTGRTLEEEFGFGWLDGVHPDDKRDLLGTAIGAAETGSPFEVEYRLRRHDGEYRWLLSSGRPRRGPDGEFAGYIGSCADITERRRSEARLARLAYADELTGLPNRRLLEDRLRDCTAGRASGRAAALLYCGLDRFKLINDGLGGAAADTVLREFADRIAAAAPDGALVVRHSGDEFVVLLEDLEPGAAEAHALTAADRLHAALAQPLVAGGEEILLSMTVGVSVCPGDARDPGQLVAHADSAMSEAKRSAPGGTRLARAPAHGSAASLSEAARLRRAIEGNELVLHYQPIVSLVTAWAELEATGGLRLGPHVRGVEALVRWQEPGGRLRMPDDFIPLAERTGLIGALGDWVVHAAVGQQAEWLERDIATMVGFNLSPIQLHDPGLVARVLTAASRLGPGASGLAMEMTESVAMADLELSRQVMADLRRAGIEIAIDDFGTGYSTLGRLRDLEVDYLKVDGSFLAGVPHSPVASGLLRGIVQLAVGAGMRPIAEGIETRAQWKFLVQHGCRRGQGFFFCGPVPADEMSAILAGQPVQIDFGATGE